MFGLLAALSLAGAAEAQVGGQQEDGLRAALVLGFARFTEWPVLREGPIVIGVVGRPSMAAALEQAAAGKMVNGRAVTVKLLRQPLQLTGCHIVYFGRLPGPKLAEALAAPREAVLTIGEEDKFLPAGGAVYLFEEDGRMSFEVSLAALQSANVVISSKLLRLGYTSGAGRRARGAR
jgi:hypothetical protein